MRRERKYHWGKADRLLQTEDSRYGTTTYEYSPTGHLQKATYADGREEYRLSDKVGNLFDDPDCKLRKYLRGGKIEQSGAWRFEYDKDGQLIEKYKGSGKWWDSKRERWKYEWNQNGTLKAVHSPHRSRPVRFAYDALGRRLCKLADEYTHWVWNGNVPLHEWNSGDTWKDNGWQHYELDLKTWVFEEESFVPMALLLNGKAYSIVTDQLGTPTEAYNTEGEEVWSRRLDMNGNILEENYDRYAPYSEQIRIPFLFQGQYYDHETELAYNRFRYYSPELGRYISEDPIRLYSKSSNLFSYVKNSNAWLDYWGLDWVYQIVNNQGKVLYYGITERNPVLRGNEHINSGMLQSGETMQIIAKDVTHDQARTIEAQKIREHLDTANVDRSKSIADQLSEAGLRNKNRGRDIDKRPFNPDTMGGAFRLLETPEDVTGLKKRKNTYQQ